MTFGPESLRLQQQRMATLNGIVDDSTRTLVRGFTRAWDQTAADLEQALIEAAATRQAGERLTWRQLSRIDRFQAAMRRLAQQLDDLAATGRVQIVDGAGEAVSVAREFEPRLIASQLPAVGPSTAELARQFNVAGPAFDQIVRRAQERIVSRMQPLSAEAMAQMRRELIRGITVGANPRVTARRMLQRLERQFAGGLTRALRIARTEQLDAYRAGNALVDEANTEVLQGWTWVAALDDRTCIACVSMHGRQFPTTTPGPEGHVQCRCDRVPVTKSWRELGFAVDEPPSLLTDGRAWFDQQPVAVRRQIAGPARLQALEDGTVGWDDLARRQHNDGWRDSYSVTPLRDLDVELVGASSAS